MNLTVVVRPRVIHVLGIGGGLPDRKCITNPLHRDTREPDILVGLDGAVDHVLLWRVSDRLGELDRCVEGVARGNEALGEYIKCNVEFKGGLNR